MSKKNPTKSEKEHIGAVAALGCIVCINQRFGQTPAEIHHIREGYGKGQRAPHDETIPLCPAHHRVGDGRGEYKGEIGFHYSPIIFRARYGTERELLEQVRRKLRASH